MCATVGVVGVTAERGPEVEADGLVIEVPDEKPCEHAFTLKIVKKDLEL